ncbi:MAG TPA: VanZ family protein [Anaerolineales bacterium]|nr:VanZ family protein [Anaerolineales bacterium]
MNLRKTPSIYKLRWLIWPQIGLALFATIIAYLDLLPRELLAWPYSDKVLHFLLFGLIAFWLRFWSPQTGSFWKQNLPVILLLTYIITEECLQSFSPYRSFDFVDMGCDLAGVLLFWGLGKWIIKGLDKFAKTA